MREIKFRAWDNENKKMVSYYVDGGRPGWDEPTFLELGLNGQIHFRTGDDGGKSGLWEHNIDYKEGRFTLMQFTGLLDKNGKEIYEGDILSGPIYHNLELQGSRIAKVEFGVISDSDGWMHGETTGWVAGKDSLLDVAKASGIIGNIHENPELLKP